MDHDTENEGDFDVINAIGLVKKPVVSDTTPSPRKPVDETDLDELQRQYLWACTFREI